MRRRFYVLAVILIVPLTIMGWSRPSMPPFVAPASAQAVTPDASPPSFTNQRFVIGSDNISNPAEGNRPTFATAVIPDPNAFPTTTVQVHNYEGSSLSLYDHHFWLSVRIRNQDVGVDVLPDDDLARMGLIPPGGDATYTVTFPPVTPAQVEFEVDGSTEEAIFLTVLQVALESGFGTVSRAEGWNYNWSIQADVAAVLEDFLPQLTDFSSCTNAVTDIRTGSNDSALLNRDLTSCLDGPEWRAFVDATVERLAERDWFIQALGRTGKSLQEVQAQIQANTAASAAMGLWSMYQWFHPEVDGAMVGSVVFLSVETIPDRMPALAPVVSDITVSQIVRRAREAIETAQTFRFETLGDTSSEEGVSGSIFGAVDIKTGSKVQRSMRGGPRDTEVWYHDWVTDTVHTKLFDGTIETRDNWQPQLHPLAGFLDTRGEEWILLGTERIRGDRAYVIHRILHGQGFEGVDIVQTLWIDAATFLPTKMEVDSNAPATWPVVSETAYFAFGVPVDVAVPQEAVTSLLEMLPTEAEIPGGLILKETGARTAEEITQTFPDPSDADQRFRSWGWQENAYRDFASPDGTSSVSVSLHRFADAQAASDALPYFAEARRMLMGFEAIPMDPMGDQVEAIEGQIAGGRELSLYVRQGAVVARVSVVTPTVDSLPIAVTTVETILGNIEQTAPGTSSSDHRG